MNAAKCPTSDREVSSPTAEVNRCCTTAGRTLRSPLWKTDPLALLERRAADLEQLVRSTSDRKDALHARARTLALLLDLRSPIGGHLRRHWYVAGAVARLGAEGLLRLWEGHGVPTPSLRRMRGHLALLEDVYAIVQQPGDFVRRKPILRGARKGAENRKALRYPDTIHVLTEPTERDWWAGPGSLVRRLHPEIRTDPRAWAVHVGNWRLQRPVQGELFGLLGDALAREAKRSIEDTKRASTEAADRLARIARQWDHHEQLLEELRQVGAEVRGRAGYELLGNPERARAAVALLSLALRRVEPPKSWGGFLVSAFRRAPAAELADAKREVVG